MKILTFSTLYPSEAQPNHGLFVEQRVRRLAASAGVQLEVVAPVPWFPIRARYFRPYDVYARAARREVRHGIPIDHPRYVVIPKIGMTAAPFLLSTGAYRSLRNRLLNGFSFDIIDAHYFYPDGVAAGLLAHRFRRPFIITARGTDVTLIPRHRAPRAMIRWAAERAAHVVTVCAALKEALVSVGVDAKKITVLRNGVDLELFRPIDRNVARADLGISNPTLLSVGNLVELKGHDLVIEAMLSLPECKLLIIGEGPMRRVLEDQIRRLGLDHRVRLLGAVRQEELPQWYSGADALVLASSREGLANVLLESMACGTPVVATAVGGTPEVVTAEVGELVAERNSTSLAEAVRNLLSRMPDRTRVRRYAETLGWNETIDGQARILRSISSRWQATHGQVS